MNIKQIEKILTDGGIELNEAKIEAKMLLQHFLGLGEVDLALIKEFDDENGREVLASAKLRAQTRKPIQYILGEAYFMGEMFKVNENVLIPRDETEILVRKAVEIIKKNDFKKVLDIGTGSGCIACMVAKGVNADVQVLGVDISSDALSTALDNSSKLGLFNRAIFRKSDLFSNMKGEKFNLIVSNPPYIPKSEKKNIQPELEFEPEGALFVNDEQGIEFYDKIILQAGDYLDKGGYLMFELGIGQSKIVQELMEKAGFTNVKIEKDLAGIDRVISGGIND